MCQFLCFSFAESAFLAIDETNFFQEVVCWYSSMKKFKIESYKFCALCTLKSHLVNLFPVELLLCCESDVFLRLLLTLVSQRWLVLAKWCFQQSVYGDTEKSKVLRILTESVRVVLDWIIIKRNETMIWYFFEGKVFSNMDLSLYCGITNRNLKISENAALRRNEQACLRFVKAKIWMKSKCVLTLFCR